VVWPVAALRLKFDSCKSLRCVRLYIKRKYKEIHNLSNHQCIYLYIYLCTFMFSTCYLCYISIIYQSAIYNLSIHLPINPSIHLTIHP